MVLDQSLDKIATDIAALDRQHCIRELKNMPWLRLDFTDEFLSNMSLDRLRHILMAAALQARKHVPVNV